VYRIG